MTITAAINWRDCYKNFFYTLFDYSNWFGPKAMWLDFCDFSSDENLQIYAFNPFDIAKDTGDLSFLKATLGNAYDGSTTGAVNTATSITVRRPSYGQSSYFRDCFVVDDNFFTDATYGTAKWGFSFQIINNLLGATFGDYLYDFLRDINADDYLPADDNTPPVPEERLGVEEILHSEDIIDTRKMQFSSNNIEEYDFEEEDEE